MDNICAYKLIKKRYDLLIKMKKYAVLKDGSEGYLYTLKGVMDEIYSEMTDEEKLYLELED